MMKVFQPSVGALLLGCVFFTATPGVALAGDGEELTSKLRTASEKFAALEESRSAYIARSEITGAIDGMERERADLIANIRQHEVVIAGMPRLRNGAPGWNNLQEGVHQDLLVLRQQLTEEDRTLEELRFRVKEMDEMTLRQAEMSGGRVREDRRGEKHEERIPGNGSQPRGRPQNARIDFAQVIHELCTSSTVRRRVYRRMRSL